MIHGHAGLRVYIPADTRVESVRRGDFVGGNVNSAAARRHRFLGGCTQKLSTAAAFGGTAVVCF